MRQILLIRARTGQNLKLQKSPFMAGNKIGNWLKGIWNKLPNREWI